MTPREQMDLILAADNACRAAIMAAFERLRTELASIGSVDLAGYEDQADDMITDAVYAMKAEVAAKMRAEEHRAYSADMRSFGPSAHAA